MLKTVFYFAFIIRLDLIKQSFITFYQNLKQIFLVIRHKSFYNKLTDTS